MVPLSSRHNNIFSLNICFVKSLKFYIQNHNDNKKFLFSFRLKIFGKFLGYTFVKFYINAKPLSRQRYEIFEKFLLFFIDKF